MLLKPTLSVRTFNQQIKREQFHCLLPVTPSPIFGFCKWGKAGMRVALAFLIPEITLLKRAAHFALSLMNIPSVKKRLSERPTQ